MATHQDGSACAQGACEVPPLLHIRHQQIRVAEIVLWVPDRNVISDRGADMHDRTQFLADDAERDDAVAVAVDDRLNIRA